MTRSVFSKPIASVMTKTAKAKAALEVATNIAVLGVSSLVFVTLLWVYFHKAPRLESQPGLRKGETVDRTRLHNYDFGKSARTLLIVMNTECSFCTESIPFYNDIAESCQNPNNQTQATAVFPNSSDEVRRYVEKQKLREDALESVDLNTLQVSATPTLILIDRNGVVLNFWIGKLSEQDQQEVMKSISGPRL